MSLFRIKEYFPPRTKTIENKEVKRFLSMAEEVVKAREGDVIPVSIFEGTLIIEITGEEAGQALLTELQAIEGISVDTVSPFAAHRDEMLSRMRRRKKAVSSPIRPPRLGAEESAETTGD